MIRASLVVVLAFALTHVQSLPMGTANLQNAIVPTRHITDMFTVMDLLSIATFDEVRGLEPAISLQGVYTWGKDQSEQSGRPFDKALARKVFKSRDLDMDGEISQSEWEDEKVNLSDAVFMKLFSFDGMDVDQNEEISLSEFTSWAKTYAKVVKDTEYADHVLDFFVLEDRNEDGVLTRDEWAVTEGEMH